jgi:autotransporter translocation and assembly factor TamB
MAPRIVVRTAKVLLWTVVAVLVLVAGGLVATQTPWFREWARGFAERQAARLLNGQLAIGRLDGTLWTGATLSDVRITQDGREVVRIERVRVTYSARQLASGQWLIPAITLTRPSIVLIHDTKGWHIASLFRPRRQPSGASSPVRLPSVTIERGTVAIEDAVADRVRWPAQVRDLEADVGLTLDAGRTELLVRRAAFDTAQPALSVSALSVEWVAAEGGHEVRDLHLRTAARAIDGSFAYAPRRGAEAASMSLRAEMAPADLQEFAGVVPGLADRGLVLTGSVRASGPADTLAIQAQVSDPRTGQVDADVVWSSQGQRNTIRGAVMTGGLDLARPLRDPGLASRLSATTNIDLTFDGAWSFDALSGSATVDSRASTIWGYRWDALRGNVRIARRRLTIDGTVAAYGARGTATGIIVPGRGPVTYDLRGRLAGVDLRLMPPQLPLPDLDTRIAGQYVVSGAGSRLDASATFDDSTVEGAAVGPGSTGRFANRDGVARYGFSGHVAGADIQRFGHALDLPSVSGDEFASRMTGVLTVDGAGTTLDTLQLDAQADLEPSQLFMAEVGAGHATAHIANRELTAAFTGAVSKVEAARVTGRQDLAGAVGGTVDLQATLTALGAPFSMQSLSGRATVTLEPSSIGPLAFDRAHLEASLAGGEAEVAMFEAVGPRLAATATGRVSLTDTGTSDLKYDVSMTRLSDLGPLVGRALDGRVQIEGGLTGNRTRLASTGRATFSGLAVEGAFDALTLNATFDAQVPDLDVRALTASVKAESTLFTVGGRTIPQLEATVDVANDRYKFETTATETGRTITAAGELVTSGGGREVTVNRLAFVTGPATWTLADDGPVQVNYDPAGRITIPRPITLVNNGQQLSAEGTLALNDATTGSMDVYVAGVNLTELGALMLSPRQLAGTLSGDARITGGPSTRSVVGNIKVLAGIVDGYAFQSFDTLLDYRGNEAKVASILIQSPGSTLEATGIVPFALDRGVLTDRPLTFDVTSAGIDLAVLEAANTGLVNAAGQLVLDVHITGTGTAPVGRGTIKVAQGAFTVAATGVRYTDATIDATVEGEELQVARLLVRDGDRDALEGSGRIRLENRAIRDIDFVARGDDFTVLDNELGRLSVDANLTLTGTLGAPKVAGDVRLHSGRLEVDQILDRFGAAPYESISQPPQAQAAPPAGTAPLALNLKVEVPDNLILRGRDIRTGGSAVGLGDVNLTAGGSFTLVREGTGGPVLVGTIATVRGTYDFQGRRFQVLRDGRITFRGERPVDPALDVSAEREISGIVAHVTVGGSMRSPELTLSSQPPLDQADILSLIVFNQPANRLTQGQATNLGERAAQIAGGFVVAPLADTLGRALNVDVFELDPSGDAGQGPSVTVGQQVGEKLFVKFRQIFGNRDVSEFQLEYQLAEFLRLQGSIADGQTSANRSLTRRVERGGIDLVVYFSY